MDGYINRGGIGMQIENFEAFKAAVKTLTERFWGQP